MAFHAMNGDFSVITDGEIAAILSHFSKEMIINTVTDILNIKFRPYAPAINNLVDNYESNYKLALSNYPQISNELKIERDDAYQAIIYKIAEYYQMNVNLEQEIDIFSAAYYMYDFFVSNFVNNVIEFFCYYIENEYNSLYEIVKIIEDKKEKDPNRKTVKYKDEKMKMLSGILSNLDIALNNMAGFDITIENIIDVVYRGNPVASFLKILLADTGNFYMNYYISFLKQYNVEIETSIKLRLNASITGNNISDYIV